MDAQSMTETPETAPASDVHPDVVELAQQIVDMTHELVSAVETLDANNWLSYADKLDALNSQLQSLIIEKPVAKKSTSSKN